MHHEDVSALCQTCQCLPSSLTACADHVSMLHRVVICGGGIIGSAIAYYLAVKGVAATVVERAFIACASSGTTSILLHIKSSCHLSSSFSRYLSV